MSIGGDGFGMSASPQNSRDLTADRALSAFHRRHNFVMSYVYELPFKYRSFGGGRWTTLSAHLLEGWEINGITTARTGQPINVTIPRDIPNIGSRGYVVRPNLVGDPRLRILRQQLGSAATLGADPYQFEAPDATRCRPRHIQLDVWIVQEYRSSGEAEAHSVAN
jgi:hypothetical protein